MSPTPLGLPRLHLRAIDSTNERARELAAAGAPGGTLVTAGLQTAGRGRQGRSWSAPPGRALLCSLILRDPPPLLPLRAGVAVA
ncbi:MAG: biotin--[acetyl-CoA-carboxylase] ligase, partial [Solirubrobacteraceae bacterium]